jgi:type IV pilus assembly protein PilV
MKTTTSNQLHAQHQQRGATLIEVLVTMLVVAIGLVGAAGLQLSSSRYQQTAHMRSQAVEAAQFIVEKIRVNGSATTSPLPPAPVNAYLAADGYAAAATLPADPACGLSAQPACSQFLAAQRDVREWRQALQRLPGGRGAIWPVSSGGFTDPAARQVVVMWTEKQQNEAGTNAVPNPLDVTDPTCPAPLVAGVRCLSMVVTP